MGKCCVCNRQITFNQAGIPHGNHLNASPACRNYYLQPIITGLRNLSLTANENDDKEVRKKDKCLGCSKKITLTKEGIPHGNHLKKNPIRTNTYQQQQISPNQQDEIVIGVENLRLTDDLTRKKLCINIRNDLSLMNLVYYYESQSKSYEDQIGKTCNNKSGIKNGSGGSLVKPKHFLDLSLIHI